MWRNEEREARPRISARAPTLVPITVNRIQLIFYNFLLKVERKWLVGIVFHNNCISLSRLRVEMYFESYIIHSLYIRYIVFSIVVSPQLCKILISL